MLFSSTFFLVYFLPVFFTLYYLLPAFLKNYFIVLGSLFFYAWGAPNFVLLLIATILLNFGTAHLIVGLKERYMQKRLLAFSIAGNLSFLIYYKYANFFIENTNKILAQLGLPAWDLLPVILPIGISFFTFHQLSFLIDVYNGVKPPMKKISDYALYILLFPQLIAGPIIRYHEISDQIEGRDKSFRVDEVLNGLFRFAIGLSKKVLIANVLGREADRIFDLNPTEIGFITAWMGALTYTFQIYFDFSGYSDMAIGLARMMGFKFPENFNRPYIAQSITDFWRRWHISLSRWMKDYLYIPLGGNKVSTLRLYLNLWFVFLISGFWHGAEWTFIFWGAYHGFFLAMERLFLLKLFTKMSAFIRIPFTFLGVLFGWVVFRSKNIHQAIFFYKKMLFFTSGEYFFSNQLLFILSMAILICFLPLFYPAKQESLFRSKSLGLKQSTFRFFIILVSLILCIGTISSSDFNPFIYFRF